MLAKSTCHGLWQHSLFSLSNLFFRVPELCTQRTRDNVWEILPDNYTDVHYGCDNYSRYCVTYLWVHSKCLPIVHVKVKYTILLGYLITQEVLELGDENFFILSAHTAELLEQLPLNIIIDIHHNVSEAMTTCYGICKSSLSAISENNHLFRMFWKSWPSVYMTSHEPEVDSLKFILWFWTISKIVLLKYFAMLISTENNISI